VTTSSLGERNSTVRDCLAGTAAEHRNPLRRSCNLSIVCAVNSPPPSSECTSIPTSNNTCLRAEVKAGGFRSSAHFFDVALQSLRGPLSSSKTKRTTTSFPASLSPPNTTPLSLAPSASPRPIALSASITRQHTYRCLVRQTLLTPRFTISPGSCLGSRRCLIYCFAATTVSNIANWTRPLTSHSTCRSLSLDDTLSAPAVLSTSWVRSSPNLIPGQASWHGASDAGHISRLGTLMRQLGASCCSAMAVTAAFAAGC
jgi:hypothetical protein